MSISSLRRIAIQKAGSLIGRRFALNLIEGANVTLTVQDDAANRRVNCTIASSGGGGAATFGPAFRATGRYLLPSSHVTPAGSLSSISAGYVVLVPFALTASVDVTSLGLIVVSASSTGVARMGVYNTDSDGAPTTVAIDSGEVSTASSGNKEATFSASTLAAGNYWLAVFGNQAFSMRAGSSWLPLVSHTSISLNNYAGIYVAKSYGALPTLTGDSFTLLTSAPTIFVGV